MHGAPSVQYPVRRPRWLARLLLLGWLVGLVALAGAWPAGDWRWALGVPVLLLTGVTAVRTWVRLPTGVLSWDGAAWQGLDGTPMLEPPVVHLDLQRLLLVRTAGSGHAGRWIWLEVASDPRRWPDLRRALHARPIRGPHMAGASHG